jgi:hypothetical protein
MDKLLNVFWGALVLSVIAFILSLLLFNFYSMAVTISSITSVMSAVAVLAASAISMGTEWFSAGRHTYREE